MRLLIGSLLITATLSIQAATAGFVVPDYLLRNNKPTQSAATTSRDANAAMPSTEKPSMPTHFYENPARR